MNPDDDWSVEVLQHVCILTFLSWELGVQVPSSWMWTFVVPDYRVQQVWAASESQDESGDAVQLRLFLLGHLSGSRELLCEKCNYTEVSGLWRSLDPMEWCYVLLRPMTPAQVLSKSSSHIVPFTSLWRCVQTIPCLSSYPRPPSCQVAPVKALEKTEQKQDVHTVIVSIKKSSFTPVFCVISCAAIIPARGIRRLCSRAVGGLGDAVPWRRKRDILIDVCFPPSRRWTLWTRGLGPVS